MNHVYKNEPSINMHVVNNETYESKMKFCIKSCAHLFIYFSSHMNYIVCMLQACNAH
jgi:hypothetical protein